MGQKGPGGQHAPGRHAGHRRRVYPLELLRQGPQRENRNKDSRRNESRRLVLNVRFSAKNPLAEPVRYKRSLDTRKPPLI
jgi:hypothetical protein